MKEVDQTIFLDLLETQAERQLTEVIEVFQNLSKDQLLYVANEGDWSIAACMAHVNSYADYYYPRIEKVMQHPTNARMQYSTFNHSWIGAYFIRIMDVDRSKKKFKAIKQHQPQVDADPHAIVATCIAHLERLLVLINEARTKDIRKLRVTASLSAFVKLNVGDALQFLLVHNKRHLLQARRNING